MVARCEPISHGFAMSAQPDRPGKQCRSDDESDPHAWGAEEFHGVRNRIENLCKLIRRQSPGGGVSTFPEHGSAVMRLGNESLGKAPEQSGFQHGAEVRGMEDESFADANQQRRQYGPQKDRKSTRLNSSHITISYAVFCLKKKRNT